MNSLLMSPKLVSSFKASTAVVVAPWEQTVMLQPQMDASNMTIQVCVALELLVAGVPETEVVRIRALFGELTDGCMRWKVFQWARWARWAMGTADGVLQQTHLQFSSSRSSQLVEKRGYSPPEASVRASSG